MSLNFTAADRVGGIGGYIGGITALLGLANGGAINPNNGGNCEGDHPVNRYEAQKDARIAELETEVKLRDANTYADQKTLAVYQYVDSRMRSVESQISAQAVVNAQVAANLGCMQNTLNTLSGMTKTVIPIDNVCPEPMQRYNSWTAPTTPATSG